MNKKTLKILLGISLLIPTLAYCGLWDYVIGNRLKMNEMKSFAKNYAEQKYHRDYEVVGLDWDMKTVFLKPLDGSSDRCSIALENRKEGGTVYLYEYQLSTSSVYQNGSPDSCGSAIISKKLKKYLYEKVIDKYFNSTELLQFSLLCDKNSQNKCKSILDNTKNYWNLSAEAWLQKFYKYLQVDGVTINVFEVEKNPENIAKAVRLAFELNKFLYGITETHIVRGISIKLYDFSQNDYQEKYNGRNMRNTKIPLCSRKNQCFKYNYWSVVTLSKCIEYKHNGKQCVNSTVPSSAKSNILGILDYVFLTSSDEFSIKNIKDTKYYSQVKNILSNNK